MKAKAVKKSKSAGQLKDLRAKKNPSGGKVKVQDISIVKTIDKPTPVLLP